MMTKVLNRIKATPAEVGENPSEYTILYRVWFVCVLRLANPWSKKV